MQTPLPWPSVWCHTCPTNLAEIRDQQRTRQPRQQQCHNATRYTCSGQAILHLFTLPCQPDIHAIRHREPRSCHKSHAQRTLGPPHPRQQHRFEQHFWFFLCHHTWIMTCRLNRQACPSHFACPSRQACTFHAGVGTKKANVGMLLQASFHIIGLLLVIVHVPIHLQAGIQDGSRLGKLHVCRQTGLQEQLA